MERQIYKHSQREAYVHIKKGDAPPPGGWAPVLKDDNKPFVGDKATCENWIAEKLASSKKK